MTIRPPLTSRIIYSVAGVGLAACFAWITWSGLQSARNPMALFGLPLIVLFLVVAFWGGRSAYMSIDDETIRYVPPWRPAKVFSRRSVYSIVRVPGVKGTSSLELRDRAGKPLLSTGASFSRADIERLAQYLAIPLTWELSWDNVSR